VKKNIFILSLLVVLYFILLFNIQPVHAYTEVTDKTDEYNGFALPISTYSKGLTAPFSQSKSQEENISKVTGDLSLTKTDLLLKGKNGLDFSLTRYYEQSQASIYNPYVQSVGSYYQPGCWYVYAWAGTSPPFFNTYTSYAEADSFYHTWLNLNLLDPTCNYGAQAPFTVNQYVAYEINYYNKIDTSSNQNRYSDLGEGWAFDLPYIENRNGYSYLHYGSAGTWLIDFSSSADMCHLKDYNLKDMILNTDNQSFSNGEKSSYYVLEQKEGKKIYFGDDGRLLGIKDKFNNVIIFKHNTTRTGSPIINYIKDSVGREINIDYSSDKVTVTVNDPTNIDNNRTILYNKTASSIDANKYVLSSVVDPELRNTSYEYEFKDAKISMLDKNYDTYVTNKYACLSKTIYPTGAETNYTYQISTKNCGNDGVMEFYKIYERSDIQDGVSYNYKKYNYKFNGTEEYDGYPTYISEATIPDSYVTQTQVVDSSNNSEIYTFNKKLLCVDLLSEGTDHKSETINEYDLVKRLLTKTEQKVFNKSTGTSISKIQNYEYDSENYRDLINYWDVQADGDKLNGEYKTTYSYDSTYHYVTSKTYKKDANTTIVEEYSPYTNDTREVQWFRLKENGLTKKQIQYVYDSYGNVIEERQYKDNLVDYISIKYDYTDNVTARNGKFNGAYMTRKWLDDVRNADETNPVTISENYTYDWFGNVLSTTDGNGQLITYTYDRLNRVTKQIYPDSSYKSNDYFTDINNNYIVMKDENFNSSEYNFYGNQTKYVFDRLGNMTDEQLWTKNSNGTYEYTTRNHYTFDERMMLKNEHNYINGRDINYLYTSDGRIQQAEVMDSKNSNQLMYEESYTYEDSDSSGLYSIVTKTIIGEDNASNIVTKTYVNKLGKVDRIINPHLDQSYTNTFKYDYLGNKIEEKSARAINEGWSQAYTTKYKYNSAGKLIDTETIEGNHFSSEYDSLGRLITTTDFKGNKTTFEYDNISRLIKQISPFNGTQSSVKKNYYDGNGNIIKSLTSSNIPGQTENWDRTDYEYNNRNMLTKVTTYKDINTPENYSQYFYDKNGNKIRMYDGLSSPLVVNGLDNVIAAADTEYYITEYSYNQLDKLISKINHSNKEENYTYKEENYTYDLNGTLQSEKDRNNSNLTYNYDILQRLKSKSVITTDGTGDEAYSFEYYLTGSKKSMSGGGIYTSYVYDDKGRLTKEIESDGITKEYTYDANDNRKTFIIKQNSSVISDTTYDYDSMNRLFHVYENGQLIATYSYDANGNRDTMTYGNNMSTKYDYNYANKLLTLTNKNASGSVISQYDYTYYLNGNQATKKDTEGVTNYKYDGLGRIDSIAGPNSLFKKYSYDDKNNRSDITATGEIFSNQEDMMFTNNGFKQLKSAVGNHNSLYSYNADGIRTSKIVDGIETTQILDDGNVVAEITGANTSKFVRGVNLICEEKDGQKYFYLYDGHGNVVQIVDSNGNVVNNYDYDEWGNIKSEIEGIENPFKYCGEYFDKETGLYYLRARYYDPTIGRFISEDGYLGDDKDPLSLNLYTYCSNNPVNLIDPSGHDNVASEVEVNGPIYIGDQPTVFDYLKHIYDSINTALLIQLNMRTAVTFNQYDENMQPYVYDWQALQNKAGADVQSAEYLGATIGSALSVALKSDSAIATEGSGSLKSFGDWLIDSFKKSTDIIYKTNSNGEKVAYGKIIQLNEDYKILIRRDIDEFSHGDANHINVEIQTKAGNIKGNLHIYVDEAMEIINSIFK
jgi:RHS repeat-associated core domain